MAVQTEHVLFRPDYQAGEQTKTLEPTEQQQLGHAFTQTPSVFQLLSTVRSRRFGMGYRYETGESETLSWSQNRTVTSERGPLAYKSSHDPHPLNEVEEALVAWAACGPNGVIAADLPVTGNMNTWLCWAGRTIPAPCNDLAVDLFIVNDQGTWMYRPVAERRAPVEIHNEDDHWKVLDWYRAGKVKISDQRIDIGAELGPGLANLTGPWQYNVNRPGSTWFIPVADLGFEWFNLLMPFYEYDHFYLSDPETGEPCGTQEFIKPGMLEVPCPVPVYDQLLLMATPGHQVGCLIQNARLAAEAIGPGGVGLLRHVQRPDPRWLSGRRQGARLQVHRPGPGEEPEQGADLIRASRDQGGHGRPVAAVPDGGVGDDRGLRDALPPGCPLRDRGQLGAAEHRRRTSRR